MNIQFKWTEEMSVGHDVIDMQHKELFDKLNVLLESILKDDVEKIIDDMLIFFEKYMNEHLYYEERYLQDIAYPKTQEHHEQHLIFTRKYEDLKQKLSDNVDKSKLAFEIETFMGTWLTNHILIEDKKYAQFVQNRAAN
jgi:hemerythrin